MHMSDTDAHPTQFVFSLCAGIHERLGNNRQWGIHYLSHMDIKDEVRILQNVHPEPQGQTADTAKYSCQLTVFILCWEKYMCMYF